MLVTGSKLRIGPQFSGLPAAFQALMQLGDHFF